MTDAEPDRESIREALRKAYQREGDEDINKYELYGYARELPDDTRQQTALDAAEDVLADPPDIAAELEEEASPDDLSDDTVTDHYDRVGDVYAELGEIDGDLCIGNTDFIGWYNTRNAEGDAYDGEGRPWGLGREFDGMRDDLDRVVYAAVNYAPSSWYLNAWRPFQYGEDGRQWKDGETPTPGYGEITTYAPFADIDLVDEVKQRRPGGEIPKAAIEDALQRYVDAFAGLAGGKKHVFALDSVGGAYVMIAPTSTAPIAERYKPVDRKRLFEDLTDRMNDWLDETREKVNDAVDVAGTFEPDLLNNKNRLYKAPLSIHSSLPGVVTPVSTERVTYDYTPITAVDDDLVTETTDWASDFTADHAEAIESIVPTLWPSYADEADTWQEALDSRLADMEAEEQANERTEERLADVEVPDDLDQTDEIDVIRKKIENIDVAGLARTLADEWDTAPGRTPKRFDPSWRNSSSGTSCYADRDKFVDLEEGKKGGGPLKLIARDRGIISDCRHKLDGDDYWKAVAELRKEGYKIPRFTGQKGTHPDNLGLYEEPEDKDDKRRKVLRALKASKRSE